MSQPGRPKKLDQKKRAEVCALVSAGVTVREAARYVGCDRDTIRNEAQRNQHFGRELERARSQARVHPLRTMHDAAAKNWRAAAWWLERLAPDEFAHPGGAVFGQREANRLAADLIEIIEQTVLSPLERERLYELIGTALPAAMRRTWDHRQSIRKLDRAMDFFDGHRPSPPPAKPTSQSPKPERARESGPNSPLELVLASFNDQLREMTQAKKQQPPTTNAAPVVPTYSARPEVFSARPAKKPASNSARDVKRRP
jgi:hypothetical protein